MLCSILGPSCLVRRTRMSVPCVMTEVSSSAVTAVPGPSTWLACPHLSRRSPGEQTSPSLIQYRLTLMKPGSLHRGESGPFRKSCGRNRELAMGLVGFSYSTETYLRSLLHGPLRGNRPKGGHNVMSPGKGGHIWAQAFSQSYSPSQILLPQRWAVTPITDCTALCSKGRYAAVCGR